MIVIRLKGGLGNQFFEYALERRLTYFNHAQFKLDISAYRTDNSRIRTYGLHHFNIVENIATDEDLKTLGIKEERALKRILSKALERRKPIYKRRRINEQVLLGFHPEILEITQDAYLDGYWQSEKYFLEIAKVIRAEFTPRDKMDTVNEEMASEMAGASSISLHIRRGDYVADPTINRIHGTCSLDYYSKCIDEVSQMIQDPHFYVFSDDIQWARTNLNLEHPVTFIDNNNQENDFKDLYLMTKCKHHIIANSSFSWWGAWLAENKDKIVFAPSRWFNDPRPGDKDLIPESWRRV